MYNIVALIGEAGSGKDTIMQEILKRCPKSFNEIISCTTRPMREGEAEGVNYFYLTPEEFAKKTHNGEMLETSGFNNWFYGTSYDGLKTNITNIGVFNPTGIYSLLKKDDVNLIVYKIDCNSKTRLLRQLNRENNPNVDEIIRRFSADKSDFADLEFEYIEVKNETKEDFELAIEQIMSSFETTRG